MNALLCLCGRLDYETSLVSFIWLENTKIKITKSQYTVLIVYAFFLNKENISILIKSWEVSLPVVFPNIPFTIG